MPISQHSARPGISGRTACRFIVIAMMTMNCLAVPSLSRLHAAISGQFAATYNVTVALADLGLSATATPIAEGPLTSIQALDDTMANQQVFIPSIATAYQKPVGTSYSNYFWRLKMANADHTGWNKTVTPSYVVTSATGSLGGRLSRTTSPTTATIPVSITTSPTQVFTQSAGSWYLYQQVNLSIDLANIAYSGTYSGTVTTTLTY